MTDLLSDVKSRLLDQAFARAPTGDRDPFEAITLHAAVSNQLWWMYSCPRVPLQRAHSARPTAPVDPRRTAQ